MIWREITLTIFRIIAKRQPEVINRCVSFLYIKLTETLVTKKFVLFNTYTLLYIREIVNSDLILDC